MGVVSVVGDFMIGVVGVDSADCIEVAEGFREVVRATGGLAAVPKLAWSDPLGASDPFDRSDPIDRSELIRKYDVLIPLLEPSLEPSSSGFTLDIDDIFLDLLALVRWVLVKWVLEKGVLVR